MSIFQERLSKVMLNMAEQEDDHFKDTGHHDYLPMTLESSIDPLTVILTQRCRACDKKKDKSS